MIYLHRLAIILLVLPTLSSAAQQRPTDAPGAPGFAADTLRLGALYGIAEQADPRYEQIRVHEEITDLTLESLATARRPQLDLSARATYQTETASLPFDEAAVPFSFPSPPKDQYEIAAEVGQLLYDGGRLAGAERLQQRRLAERTAEVRAALFGLRQELNAAFFAALLHQEQREQLSVLSDDLDARRRLVAAQVRSGTALPSDESALEAEIIHLQQRIAETEAARRAALRRLELLTGRNVSEGDILAAPDLERDAAAAIHAIEAAETSAFSRRPEFDRFRRARERAQAEAETTDAALKPRISAFARVAVGRPGYDFFDDAIRPYGMIGLRAGWAPFDWGATSRRSAAVALQADVIAAEEAAFEARLRRDVLDAVYAVERLEAVLASDAHAVALRERIERAALRQLEEGVLLTAEYVARRNDVFEARLRQRMHRVELAEARVRLLTILGFDIPSTADGLREPVAPLDPSTIHPIQPDR